MSYLCKYPRVKYSVFCFQDDSPLISSSCSFEIQKTLKTASYLQQCLRGMTYPSCLTWIWICPLEVSILRPLAEWLAMLLRGESQERPWRRLPRRIQVLRLQESEVWEDLLEECCTQTPACQTETHTSMTRLTEFRDRKLKWIMIYYQSRTQSQQVKYHLSECQSII